MEHACWVVFEDIFLVVIMRRSVEDMHKIALQTARFERSHEELGFSAAQLASSYEKERAIIEGALDAVIQMDSNGRVTSWNGQAEQIFGWSAKEAVARTVAELIIPPHMREAQAAGLRAYRESGHGALLNKRLEVEGLRRDGTTFPLEIAITPVTYGEEPLFCAFIRDITARKLAEEALQESEERFRMLMEAAPQSIVLTDPNGKIVLVNIEAEMSFGYSRDEMLGQNVEMLVPQRQRKDFAAGATYPYLRPMSSSEESFGLRKDGTELPVEIGLNPMHTPEGMHVLATIVDVTEATPKVLRAGALDVETMRAVVPDLIVG